MTVGTKGAKIAVYVCVDQIHNGFVTLSVNVFDSVYRGRGQLLKETHVLAATDRLELTIGEDQVAVDTLKGY